MLQPRIFHTVLIAAFSLVPLVQCRMKRYDPRFQSSLFPTVEAYEIRRENADSYPSYPPPPSSSSSGMRMVNVSRNSDLLFGEVTKSDSALLLQCRAPYPVQWVFRGDSDPEFNTNTSTTPGNDGGAKMYSAHLYLGSRRNLNERETGKYICTSVRNKRQYSFIYIFVTGAAIFTNKGLETIHYSVRHDSVRIPCSLSEPRAIATLQKSEDGVLKCPMNDSVRFSPKEGFIVNPQKLNKPEGTYLCIADYNNNFQIIKYGLVQEEEAESGDHENESSEFEPSHQPPTNPHTTPMPFPPPAQDSGKCDINCGENAVCEKNKNGAAVCKCMEGYTGNPYVECKQKLETSTASSAPPSHGDNSGSDTDYPCESYDDCPYDRACYQNKCQDPCRVNSICGPHTHCHTINHTPICECDEGYEGDPYSSQEGQRCEKSHCNPNPCGPNSNCNYVNGIIACSCKPGYATQNDAVCRPHLTKEESMAKNPIQNSSTFSPPQKQQVAPPTLPPQRQPPTPSTFAPPKKQPLPSTTSPQKQRPIPAPLHNRTRETIKTAASRKECRYDIDCPDSEMCVHDKCEDPCVNACGAGATCHTRNHFPRCVCPEGSTGDPFYKCTPLFSEIIGSSSPTFPPPSTSTASSDASKGEEVHQVNCGGKYSPCGPNSVCQATRNHFVCACPNNFLGDPYSKRGCFAERGYSRCDRDDDCFHFLTCLRGRGCVNPCNVMNVCKPGRSCVPHLHKPACLKTNLDGETLRDGLVTEDKNNELNISEIPETVKNSSCFVKTGDKIISPCGRNSICYDANTNMVGISQTMPVCGCMAGYVGDPYVSCEPLQKCKNITTCGENESCMDGYCKERDNDFGSKKFPERRSSSNPCSPSPCPSPDEQCVIIRAKNNAVCLTPGQSIKDGVIVTERAPLSNRFRSRSGCPAGEKCEEVTRREEDDEADDEIEGNSTTEWATDITLVPPTTPVSASYISSMGSASASIEDADSVSLISPRYFMHSFNFSNENTLSVVDI